MYKLSSLLAVKSENGLHPKHRIMNYHDFFLKNIHENEEVLDIGCGNGSLAFDLSKKSKKVIAVDIDKGNIAIARKINNAKNIEYIVADVRDYQFNRTFDTTILSNVLEHIKYRIEILKKIKKLAPSILIRVPMYNRDWITPYKQEFGIEWIQIKSIHDKVTRCAN